MKDDLLIRFIDGNTTPEETELVIKELSQDGEAAKEWLQMVQGARLADTKPASNIEPNDFILKSLAGIPDKQKSHKKIIRLPWIVSGIAAVAASVAIIYTITIRNVTQEIPQNIMAESSDTTTVIPNIDSKTTEKDITNIKKESHQAVAEAVLPKADNRDDLMEFVENKKTEKQQIQEQSAELVGHMILPDSKTATASQIQASSFEMIKPVKSPYRVRVQNPEKKFVFEWEAENVAEIHLTITDKNSKIIIDTERILGSNYGIAASELVDKGILDWTIEASFNDGTSHKKSGKIELVSVK